MDNVKESVTSKTKKVPFFSMYCNPCGTMFYTKKKYLSHIEEVHNYQRKPQNGIGPGNEIGSRNEMNLITTVFPFILFCLLSCIILPVIYSLFIRLNLFSYISSPVSSISNKVLCSDSMLPSSIEDKLKDIRYEVVGQPFVSKNLVPVVVDHFNKKIPITEHQSKPLVLYFHGPSGVGKTLVADYFSKMNFFIKTYIFSSKRESRMSELELQIYKDDLKEKIESAVNMCKRSLFIFEDVTEKLAHIFTDLPPFKRNLLEDYSQSMFIYISQEGSEDIVATTSTFLKNGIDRRSFNLIDFADAINASGGLLGTTWSRPDYEFDEKKKNYNVKDLYIPFLPLDAPAVQKCIQVAYTGDYTSKMNEAIVEDVLSSIGCHSREVGEFCPTGCKQVPTKLALSLVKHNEL